MLITLFVYIVFKSYLYKKINRDSIPTRVRAFFGTQRVYSVTLPPLPFQYRVGRSLLFQCWCYTTPFVKSLPPIYSIYPYRSLLLLNKDTIKKSIIQTFFQLFLGIKKGEHRPPNFPTN